jgi:dihydroxyacetone kinase DhaKLM complex PTS-EIIA-like component DhaM
LLATGKLRMVSGQPIVDGALNAVAQTAMRNSVDSVF